MSISRTASIVLQDALASSLARLLCCKSKGSKSQNEYPDVMCEHIDELDVRSDRGWERERREEKREG